MLTILIKVGMTEKRSDAYDAGNCGALYDNPYQIDTIEYRRWDREYRRGVRAYREEYQDDLQRDMWRRVCLDEQIRKSDS